MNKFIFFILLFCFVINITSQNKKHVYFNVDSFYGIALEHDKSLSTAIQGNPYGFMVGYSIKNTKNEDWLTYYNYPEFGISALYQNTNSTILGEMYGAYIHYNFYLNNRNSKNKFLFRPAFGLGYISNPYHEITNPYNFTLATKFAGTAYFKLNYQREFIQSNLGVNTGITIIHFSNAAFKNPNLGLNTFVFNVGLNYNLTNDSVIYPKKEKTKKTIDKINYNLLFRTGINESKNAGSGQYPFYVGTFQVSKKINFKSSLTSGIDFFKANFLNKYLQQEKELITNIEDNTLYNTNRVGLFIGHELYINHFSMVSQIGYNVYYPNKYVSRVYERFGFKTKLSKHFFTELTLKLNLFRAEGLEFGIGYKI